MIYIFICEGLLIFRFVHLKIYLFKILNWIINILTLIIIILIAISINELKSKVYRFYRKNNNFYINNNNEKIFVEYINLYVNKDDELEYYELCYEIKFNYFKFEKIKNAIPNFHWYFDNNLNHYIGCKNYSFEKYKFADNFQRKNFFFNCPNNFDTNTAPNFCVSSKYRQKRFYSLLKITIYEILILFLWNLYNYYSLELIYHYYPFLKDNLIKKNNFYNNKYNINYEKKKYKNTNGNQTATYRDLHDKEISDREYAEEEEEENEEENINNNEENKKQNIIKEYKIRRISKKKMKSYKKKRKKNRYKEEQIKNNNNEILNKDNYENNEDNDDDELNGNNDDDKEETFFKTNNNNDLDSNKEKNNKHEKYEENIEKKDYSKEKGEEETHNYISKNKKFHIFWENYLAEIRKHHYIHRLFNFIFGKYIDSIKNKIHRILLDIDKNLNDDDE